MTDNTPFGGTVVPVQYQAQILTSAAKWGVSPALLAAQLDAESSFNPNAVSSAGAVGIAQFLPSTAKSVGVDPYNVNAAIDGMANLDKHYFNKFGSWDLALAAYNAGEGAVSDHNGIPPFPETQNYVKKILAQAGSAVGPGVATPIGTTVSSTVDSLTQVLSTVGTVAFWKRIGIGAVGIGAILAGTFFLAKNSGEVMTAASKVIK